MNAKLTQKYGEVEDNPIGLPKETAATLVKALNDDLGTAYGLYHQYKKHHWVVTGPEFRDLHLFLDDQAKGTLEAADHLAERVTALGGVPLSAPAGQQQAAGFEFEPEGVYPVRSMLERDLQAEQVFIKRLRAHTGESFRLGDYGTHEMLLDLLEGAENRAHHLDHFLQKNGMSLEVR